MNNIKFKTVSERSRPILAKIGEPVFCTDTLNLYIGMGSEPAILIGIVHPDDLEDMIKFYNNQIRRNFSDTKMPKNIIIQFKRGNLASLPNRADEGEPLFCTNTSQLYIGTGRYSREVRLIGLDDLYRVRTYYNKKLIEWGWITDMCDNEKIKNSNVLDRTIEKMRLQISAENDKILKLQQEYGEIARKVKESQNIINILQKLIDDIETDLPTSCYDTCAIPEDDRDCPKCRSEED